MVVAAIFTGVVGAVGAVLFRLLIRFVTALSFEGPAALGDVLAEGVLAEASDPLHIARGLSWYWTLAIPAAGGLVVGPLIHFFAPEARGHGVPEVMKAVALKGGVIRARVVAIKAFASAISIGTGGSVGREGPIIQIGAAFGSNLGQLLRLSTVQIRTLVGCGAAAGISATFNAPIAGAIFASEVILGDFAVTAFTPIVISSVVATVVSRFFLGNHPAFEVPGYEIVSPFELFPYMIAGIAAGLVAVAFIRALGAAEDLFERVPIPAYLKAGLGGLVVGMIAIELPEVFGVGYSTISLALAGSISVGLAAVLVLAKIAATSITIGSGGSGGVFAPSLFLGAMAGSAVGGVIHQWFPDSTASSGAYALVTMGAVVAAATHAPISAIIIIFELTQTIDIIPALMAACVLSTLVSQLLNKDSIYASKLVRQGFDIFKKEDPNVLKGLFVRDVIDSRPEVIPASANFRTLLDLVVQSHHTQFFVVDSEQQLMGTISLSEVRRLIYEEEALRHLVVARDLVDPTAPTVTENDDLDLVMHLFTSASVDELAVVDPSDRRRLVGIVREQDVIEASNRETLRRDLVGGLSSHVGAVAEGRNVDLGGGFALCEVRSSQNMIGSSLRQLALRERTGVMVLLVRRAQNFAGDPAAVRVPSADDVLEEGDTLVVAGSAESLKRLDTLRRPAR